LSSGLCGALSGPQMTAVNGADCRSRHLTPARILRYSVFVNTGSAESQKIVPAGGPGVPSVA